MKKTPIKEITNRLSNLSDNSLYVEHDILKTLIYRLPYSSIAPEIYFPTWEFNTSEDFKHLAKDIGFKEFVETFSVFDYFNLIDYSADNFIDRDTGMIRVRINENNMRLYITTIEKEISRRKTSTKGRRILTIDEEKNLFRFKSGDSNEKIKTFRKETNEYKVIKLLANNLGKTIGLKEIEKQLNPLREQADASSKERIRDIVKSIRNKLGKEILTTKDGSYILDCEVIIK